MHCTHLFKYMQLYNPCSAVIKLQGLCNDLMIAFSVRVSKLRYEQKADFLINLKALYNRCMY